MSAETTEPTSQVAYKVPRHLAPIELRLDGNEGQVVSQSLVDTLGEMDANELRIYPSTRELETYIASLYDVDPNQVLVTAGADDGLLRMCRAYLSPTKNLVLPEPTFEMINRFAQWCFAGVRSVAWTSSEYPLEEVIRAADDTTSLIAVVSPNNPTGGIITSESLVRLAQSVPRQMLMVDCAYAEFADDDITQTALTLPNAVVFRTLSKALGLAGLRVGFAMGPAAVIDKLRAVGMPYPVSAPSLQLAQAGLAKRDESKAYVERVKFERTVLTTYLQSQGIGVLPSQGNFILARTPDALWWRDALAGFGIGVRVWPNHPLLADAVRITCPGVEGDFDRLKTAIETILKPQAILFDIDGVLADVSKSYRAVILATAAEFGVNITTEDIENYKLGGQANNDWLVTQGLLQQNGVTVEFERVKETFEALYWGSGSDDGLCLRESFIGSTKRLSALSNRLPIAAVTGRPQKDAFMFLERFEILPLFSAVITMEDGPAKPNPAPVKAALNRLGVARAWMLGDTRDDIDAARGALVLPLGVVTPTDTQPETTRDTLLRAGAARVLNQWNDVESYLS